MKTNVNDCDLLFSRLSWRLWLKPLARLYCLEQNEEKISLNKTKQERIELELRINSPFI